jgi:hypothetical protein
VNEAPAAKAKIPPQRSEAYGAPLWRGLLLRAEQTGGSSVEARQSGALAETFVGLFSHRGH